MMPASSPAWSKGALFSPVSGLPLEPKGSFLLVAGDEAWPVLEGIAFLRADRIEMARAAVALIEAGDPVGATALLLTDQDPFAPEAPPSVAACRDLVCNESGLTFRCAMQRLGFGRVADYFAHRWTDPTFLSGLALLGEAGFEGPLLELASGAGHFLRAAELAGVEAAGADLVFAKLWLARRFVSPQARLVCFDASVQWPLAAGSFAGVFCHDAFYFIPDKPVAVAQMRRIVGEDGSIAIGHAHNASADNHSAGNPLTVNAYAALLPDARLFDDRELTGAFVEDRPAEAGRAAALSGVAAVSILWHGIERPRRRGFGSQAAIPRLRLNPLYRREGGSCCIEWPSGRYEQEYADLATYPRSWDGPDEVHLDAASAELFRKRIYVDLPARW